jgi:glycosyltransferase involved in cell wall biosynthesis
LGKYLPATVEAATRALWDDLEIILVDDGSTDPESREMVDRLESEGPANLRVIRKANGGLASARNRGAEEAAGEYLMLLDADDLFDPSFVPRAVDLLRRYDNVHIVYSWERYMDASKDVFPCWNLEFPYLLGHNMTCPISLMYRQSYLTYGPSMPAMAYNFEDFELWISLLKAGCGGVALVDPLSFYRIRNDSMWQGSAREQHLFLQDLIASFHPDLYAAYGAELFCLQNANGSAQKWIKPSALSPFDEYLQWSGEHIAGIEAEAKKWWLHSVETEKRLAAAEKEKYELWCEKNRIEAELLRERAEREDASS